MKGRRTFLIQAAGGLAATLGSVRNVSGTDTPSSAVGHQSRIKSVILRDETSVMSGGKGWVGGLTWADDGRLLMSVGEGGGWPGLPEDLYFCTGLVDVHGGPQDATFDAVPGYPVLPIRSWYRPNGKPLYYGAGILAVDKHVYQYVFTFNGSLRLSDHPIGEARTIAIFPEIKCTKLIYSSDGGATWRNQDGSHPVIYEAPENQSKKSMIFWDEPDGLFHGVGLVQMGKGYGENRDGYVYGYSMGKDGLAMFRVPKTGLLDRGRYEFFAGSRNSSSHWSKEIKDHAPVHTFPKGGWACNSIVYNAPLKLYMMTATWGHLKDALPERYDPTSFGLWVSANPWGPWEQVYENPRWTPDRHPKAWVVNPAIVPKWISSDGTSFWMSWTDLEHTSEHRETVYRAIWNAASDEEAVRYLTEYRRTHPRYRFLRQRVDLSI